VWYAASKGAVTAVSDSFREMRGIKNELSIEIRYAQGVLVCRLAPRGIAAEYAKDQIRYNCIQPTLGETSM
jgi:NAD(P)-dependent dehydrogenase (short-subunit alcohol dehydrogenase family)